MHRYSKIEKVRRIMDRVAYSSLFLDVCIAIITALSILKIGNPEIVLIPVNYLLTIVVALSIGLFVTLFWLRHEESILDNLLNRRYRYRPQSRLIRKLKFKLRALYQAFFSKD
jgi:hypothetical protein